MDKRNPSGFTIVEIILFFAVSTALMLGIITGVATSIGRQRYNDTVNDFAEYLRSVYSEVQSVTNGESTATDGGDAGRSNKAIYGKLLHFTDGSTVNSYTISGIAVSQSFTRISTLGGGTCNEGMNTKQLLGCVKAVSETSDSNRGAYKLIWDGKAETTTTGTPFTGCVLIVRSPVSGVIQTYSSTSMGCQNVATNADDITTYFSTFSDANDVDFCVQSDDKPASSRRRNIRIRAKASNSSGVLIPELDSLYNVDSNPDGSKC